MGSAEQLQEKGKSGFVSLTQKQNMWKHNILNNIKTFDLGQASV